MRVELLSREEAEDPHIFETGMHMRETPTPWQALLDEAVKQMDNKERQQLYKAVGVNRIAIRRWVLGDNYPNGKHLSALIEAVPLHYQEPLRALIMQDPKLRKLLPSLPSESLVESSSREKIP